MDIKIMKEVDQNYIIHILKIKLVCLIKENIKIVMKKRRREYLMIIFMKNMLMVE
jgi:hypothetical protein